MCKHANIHSLPRIVENFALTQSLKDITMRQSICRRLTACLEQPSSCHP